MTGRYLFNGANKQDILNKNKRCNFKKLPDYMINLSEHCKELVLWMLNLEPGNRPTAKEALLHPWFKSDEGVI